MKNHRKIIRSLERQNRQEIRLINYQTERLSPNIKDMSILKKIMSEKNYFVNYYKGVRYEIKRSASLGHFNGYIKVTKRDLEDNHDLIDQIFHGGITYEEKFEDGFKLGFDCAHFMDTIPFNPFQTEIFDDHINTSTYKDFKFVEENIKETINNMKIKPDNLVNELKEKYEELSNKMSIIKEDMIQMQSGESYIDYSNPEILKECNMKYAMAVLTNFDGIDKRKLKNLLDIRIELCNLILEEEYKLDVISIFYYGIFDDLLKDLESSYILRCNEVMKHMYIINKKGVKYD